MVGYQNKAASEDGLNWVVSTFLPVGTAADDVTLADLSVSEGWDPTQDSVQLFNGNGGTAGLYTYINAEVAADNEIEGGAGWYDSNEIDEGNFVKCDSVSIPYGTGMAIACADSSTAMVFAGEVQKGTVAFAMSAGGLNWTGNALPVDITLGDMTAGETWDPTQDSVQYFNGNGGTAGLYTYISAEVAADNEIEGGAGWYDSNEIDEGNFVPVNNVELPAGKAFAVSVATDNTTVILPKALD